MIKQLIILIILVLFKLTTLATVYQIANQSAFDAFDQSTLVAGDQILFNKGETFIGTITVHNSGTSGNPITYGAYGTGANPIITGLTTISEWTNEGGGIYSKVITSEAQTNMVTVDGVNTAMGRSPNSTYLTYESFNTNVSITDTGLGTSINWTGAEIVIRKNDWTLDRCLITNHSGDVLTYNNLGSTQNATANYGYFIQNDLRTLDQLGEWYHSTSTGKFYMYFGVTNPTSKTVKVATVSNLVNATSSNPYITIQDISFIGCIDTAIKSTEANTGYTINNCVVSFAGMNGIWAVGTSNTVTNNQISDCAKIAIRSNRPNVVITGNTITNIGIIEGQSVSGGNNAISIGEPSSALVQNNIIENIGYNGIYIGSYNSTGSIIRNNFINNPCKIVSDGGGIYTGGTHTSLVIDGNIILNVQANNNGTNGKTGQGEGVYLDEYANGITVQNNTISNCNGSGIKIHKGHDNIIQNNTCYNNARGITFLNSESANNIVRNTLTRNIFVAKYASTNQYCLYIYSPMNDIASFGTATNNYYARPIDDANTIFTYQPNTGYVYRTLASWQSFTNQDANSHKSPFSISSESDIRFEYNATNENKTVILDQNYRDIVNNADHTAVTLGPYTSIILLKHAAYQSTSTRKSVSGNKKTIVDNGNVIRN